MKVVLVLGGGGAKAIAHAGAWQAIGETGAQVTHVIGTSMGAVIGAALAAGASGEEVLGVARSLGPKDVASIDLRSLVKGVFAASLLKARVLRRTIGRLVRATRFDELKIPFALTTTDLDSGELVLFGAPMHGDEMTAGGPVRHLGSDVPLVDALYASCALPLYFPPAQIAGRRLADGGLRAVLPLGVAACVPGDLIVALHVGPGFDESVPSQPSASGSLPALVRAHGEAIRVMMAAETERVVAAWPQGAPRLVVVRAVAEREATFAVGQSDRYFTAGYEATKRALANGG